MDKEKLKRAIAFIVESTGCKNDIAYDRLSKGELEYILEEITPSIIEMEKEVNKHQG